MVEKGDPPFTIVWSKDGEPISAPGTAAAAFGPAAAAAAAANDPRHSQTPPGLRVTNIDAHSSAIVIERVTAAHTGNYTCLARNSVAEVLWTAELIVRGKVESQLPRNAPSLCLVYIFLSLTRHCLAPGSAPLSLRRYSDGGRLRGRRLKRFSTRTLRQREAQRNTKIKCENNATLA